ncbi:unnamed protein product [Adineta steineri]|uniref:Uncharacterized protein n=1 Tax=Adineta steineri TaxID=433720 RepID=A0A814CI07_9BILA|nr:unnamed protein product [Adineta steineri]CAF0941704.1 unnamed protein product [Adineta steineri]
MNGLLIAIFCITVVLPISINGLQCYSCTLCNTPFMASNTSISMMNTTTGSCFKATTAATVSRGYISACVAVNAGGYGTYCCNTDLCNSARSMMPMNLNMFIAAFLVVIGTMKMLRSY